MRVTDFADAHVIDNGLADLTSAFAHFETLEGTGTKQLWSVLGKVYELGAQIEKNDMAKIELAKRVSEDPNVQDSPKWNPEKKTAHELLLVSLLSLKNDNRAKRSQWLSAIKAARTAGTPANHDDFVAFVQEAGGVDAARKRIAKPRKEPKPDELIKFANGFFDEERSSFNAPESYSPVDEFANELGIVLVKATGNGREVVPLATISNEKLVKRVVQCLIKTAGELDRETRKSVSNDSRAGAMAWRKTLLQEHAAYSKSRSGKSHPLEFAEFAEQQIADNHELGEYNKRTNDLLDKIVQGRRYRH